MPITVERYWDQETLEIKLQLPQGDSFIVAEKQTDGFYDLSVILPWYVRRHCSVGGGVSWDKRVYEDEILSIYESPVYELIAIVREALPVLEAFDRDTDLDI